MIMIILQLDSRAIFLRNVFDMEKNIFWPQMFLIESPVRHHKTAIYAVTVCGHCGRKPVFTHDSRYML